MCSDPPCFYISFHGGDDKNELNDIHKYSRTGEHLDDVLHSAEGIERRGLRGMFLTSNGSLLVSNSYKYNSMVLSYGVCDDKGKRSFERVLLRHDNNSGLLHPYSVVGDKNDIIYITNQGTNSVLRVQGPLSPSPGAPIPSPPSLTVVPSLNEKDTYPGLFIQFDPSSDGVRGGDIWEDNHGNQSIYFVASKDKNQILAVQPNGSVVGSFTADDPIGVYVHSPSLSLFYSNSGDSNPGVVLIDLQTAEQKRFYSHPDLTHPTGMVVFNGVLYVLAQDDGSLMAFDVETGEFKEKVIKGFEDAPEQIILSPC